MLKPILLIILITTMPNLLYAQDTTHTQQVHYLGIRNEIGWNRSWFTSVGISSHFHTFSHTPRGYGGGIGNIVLYAAAEVNYANYFGGGKTFYGYKTGAEIGVNGVVIGVEIKGLTDFIGAEHGYFTPKAGLGLGYGNLLYGYNIFQEENNYFGVGTHQISLSVNLGWKVKQDNYKSIRGTRL